MGDTGDLTKHDQVLLALTASLQAAGMHQLGKLVDPMTGKLARDLEQARATIDVLEMLKAKCRTDTPAAVLRVLENTVLELQMNYLDELRRDQRAADASAQAEAGAAADGES